MGVVACYYRYMRNATRYATALALALSVGACGEETYLVGASCQSIVLGDEVGDGPTRSTVGVHGSVGDPTCTGVYIAPTVVLTAAHCGNPAYVSVGNVVRSNILYVPHPQFNPEGLVNDLALVFLDGELPSDIAKLATARTGEAMIQGYGYNECGIHGILREATVNVIDTNIGAKLLTGPGSDACFGDSGGPMYQGSNVVAIVTSGLPGPKASEMDACGPGGYYTQVANYANWLNSEVDHLYWVGE